jgi:uncharacterized membrane protein YqaE (UPF0057 family)
MQKERRVSRAVPVASPFGTAALRATLVREVDRSGDEMDLIRIIAAVILPPLGVFLEVGIGKHFWINILLTLLGYIPGIVHAVYIIARR